MNLESTIRNNAFLKAVLRPVWKIVRVFKILKYYVDIQPFHHPSAETKRWEIVDFNKRSKCRVFVETGTFLGHTTNFMADHFDICHSIELDETLHRQAVERFAGNDAIIVHHGSSASVLPEIMTDLDEPAFFWLDAHYSRSVTAGASQDAPIEIELRSILEHRIKNHTIFIDDSRSFLGVDGYPTVRQVITFVKRTAPHYTVSIQNDAIRIYRSDYTLAEEQASLQDQEPG